jgi:cell wall-associated NlpC family hydrolase
MFALLPRTAGRRPSHAARSIVLAAALGAALSACTVRVAGVPVTLPGPARAPGRTTPGPPTTSPPPASRARVLRTADRYVGVPYRWGGTSPTSGFDCSGYVQYVYRREGVRLPRTSRQQAAAGTRRPTRWDAAGPGDLVMFANPGEAVSHVAFYVGGQRILHATSSGGGVRYDDLTSSRGQWYRRRLVAVRRVSDRGPAVTRALLAELGLTTAPLDPPDRAPRPR